MYRRQQCGDWFPIFLQTPASEQGFGVHPALSHGVLVTLTHFTDGQTEALRSDMGATVDGRWKGLFLF